MSREEYLDKLSDEFMDIITNYVPDDIIMGNGYSDISFRAYLTDKFISYSNSPYYYNKPMKFVHWTTIQNLMSIINYREIRLYNLHNSSDENEFQYAAEKLNITEDQIDYSKNYLFTFSFCEADKISSINHWNDYGRNYEGVALEFEIVNDRTLWKNFILSPVYYDMPYDLIKLEEALVDFKNRYPGSSTNVDLGKLIAFHKRPDFRKESEVRLSNYFPYQSMEEYEFYCNTEFRFDPDRPRVTDYFGLKLWVDNTSAFISSFYKPELDRSQILPQDYFVNNPQIKIRNIYFGKNCGIDNQSFLDFRSKLDYIIKLKLGYEIDNLSWNLYE